MKMFLSDEAVKALEEPGLHRDSEVAGLGVRVTAGAKSWTYSYSVAGVAKRITLAPAWQKVEGRWRKRQGRAAALKLMASHEHAKLLGEDPAAVRKVKAAKVRATANRKRLGALVQEFEAQHVAKKRPSTAAEYRSILHRIIVPFFGEGKPVADIARDDVRRLHAEVSKRAPIRANRTRAVLSKMLSFAVEGGHVAENVARGLLKEDNPENERETYLQGPAFGALLDALDQHPEQSADVVRLCLFTGCRRGEALGARWDQFDLERGVWAKPASTTKQRKKHVVHLSDPAVEVVRAVKARRDKALRSGTEHQRRQAESPFLFPSPTDPNEHQKDVKHYWQAVRETATVLLWRDGGRALGRLIEDHERETGELPSVARVRALCEDQGVKAPEAGLLGVRLHDLRHSYASALQAAGFELHAIGKLLGHSNPKTTQRYAHLYDDVARAAGQSAAAIINRREPKAAPASDADTETG